MAMDYEWSTLENRYVLKTETLRGPLKVIFAAIGAVLILLLIFFLLQAGPIVSKKAQGAVLEKAVDIQMQMDSIRETK